MSDAAVMMPGRAAADWPVALLLDLDGVVYTDDTAVPGAVAAIAAAGAAGSAVRYVTNNAFRTPEQVAQRLRRLGATVTAGQVVTSSVVAAEVLSARRASGWCSAGPVAVVGGAGLTVPLHQAGFEVVPARGQGRGRPLPAALVQGFTPDLVWADLAGAAYLVRQDVWWLATNLDVTLPTDNGPAPGNGSLVQAVATAAGRGPDAVAGKPAPAMMTTAARDAGADDPGHALVVGDRLDTDIAGAAAAGCRSMLVLSGVHGVADAIMTPASSRPTFLGAGLQDLLGALPLVVSPGLGQGRCADVEVSVRVAAGHAPSLSIPVDADGLDLARALLAAAWSALDALPEDVRAAAAAELGRHPEVVLLDRRTRPTEVR